MLLGPPITSFTNPNHVYAFLCAKTIEIERSRWQTAAWSDIYFVVTVFSFLAAAALHMYMRWYDSPQLPLYHCNHCNTHTHDILTLTLAR